MEGDDFNTQAVMNICGEFGPFLKKIYFPLCISQLSVHALLKKRSVQIVTSISHNYSISALILTSDLYSDFLSARII